MQLKRWESPRREGRKNPTMQRQIKKATQALRRKIEGMGKGDSLGLLF